MNQKLLIASVHGLPTPEEHELLKRIILEAAKLNQVECEDLEPHARLNFLYRKGHDLINYRNPANVEWNSPETGRIEFLRHGTKELLCKIWEV